MVFRNFFSSSTGRIVMSLVSTLIYSETGSLWVDIMPPKVTGNNVTKLLLPSDKKALLTGSAFCHMLLKKW